MDLGRVATAWANAGGRIGSRRLPAWLSISAFWLLLLTSLSEKKRAAMLARLGRAAFGHAMRDGKKGGCSSQLDGVR
jgi:hypothetical protein